MLAVPSRHVLMDFMTMARKSGSKNNATTHGAYAKDLFLPEERPEEFELLHQGLTKEWHPTGTLEDDTVLTLAQCIWNKRRIERFYREEALEARYQNADEVRLVHYVVAMLDQAETVEQANPFISMLPEAYGEWIEEEAPRSEFEDDRSWIECVWEKILILSGTRERLARVKLDGKCNRNANLRELTGKKIALDEMLDARIDKAVKRLAQLKTFKQIVEDRASQTRAIDHQSISD